MSGTKTGGIQAVKTNKLKYGDDFYARIGAIGGHNGHTGGFAGRPDLARLAGMKGGRMPKHGRGTPEQRKAWAEKMHAAKREAQVQRVQKAVALPVEQPRGNIFTRLFTKGRA